MINYSNNGRDLIWRVAVVAALAAGTSAVPAAAQEITVYVIEGHVPADTIKRLLRERPLAAGLAAPGMPKSAPGMDMPGEPYSVMRFSSFGMSAVYERR